jgi:phage I-like protein
VTAPKGSLEDQVRRELLRRLLEIEGATVADMIALSKELREPALSESQKKLLAHDERLVKLEKEVADLKNLVALKRVQAQPVKREGPMGQFLGGM